MNRIYRLVFNRALNRVQVASEHAKRAHNSATGCTGAAGPASRKPLAFALAILLGGALTPGTSHAYLPTWYSPTPGAGGGGQALGAMYSGNGGWGGLWSSPGQTGTAGSDVSGSTGVTAGGMGGLAGTAGTPNGGDGTAGSDVSVMYFGGAGGGGGGGGGYAAPAYTAGAVQTAGAVTGGNGGNGGPGGNSSLMIPPSLGLAGAGGGGGAGAVALQALSGVASLDISGNLTGGAGGGGGAGGYSFDPTLTGGNAGSGGGGGAGLYSQALSNTLDQGVTVRGGAGGAGGLGGAENGGGNGTGGAGGSGGLGGAGALFYTTQTNANGSAVGMVESSATIYGGDGGTGGVGGDGYNPGAGSDGAAGGDGINALNFNVTNLGAVYGGTGGSGGSSGTSSAYPGTNGNGGNGGTGATINNGSVTNVGTVQGGDGGNGASGTPTAGTASGNGGTGGFGGVGINLLGSGSTLTNSGDLRGGQGGDGGEGGAAVINPGHGGAGGSGGAGASLASNELLSNTGRIVGGNGGNGGLSGSAAGVASTLWSGGAGGDGVDIVSNNVVINQGTITAGNGGSGASGGVGLSADSNNIIYNGGTISSGLPCAGVGCGNLGVNAAVVLSGDNNTLILSNGYQFNGVVQSLGANNTLELGDIQTASGSSGNATFDVSQIGTEYVGFATYNKSGQNVWTLTGTTSEVTPWTVLAGTLSIAADASLGDVSGALTLNGGALQTTANLVSDRAIAIGANGGTFDILNSDTTLAGVISGYAVTKAGSGTLTLTGANTFVGMTVENGVLAVGSDSALGDTSGTLTLDGGTLSATTGFSTSRLINLGSGNGTIDTGSNTVVDAGLIAGVGGLTKIGTGTLSLGGVNSYQGSTTISGGTLALGGAGDLSASSGIIVSTGATFDVSAHTGHANIQSLAGSGNVNLGQNDLILTNAHDTFAGNIGGQGGLTVSGGTETLSGTNTYTGSTTVTGTGNLVITNTGSLASGSIANNGVVMFAQSGIITSGNVLSGTGGVVQNGAGTTILNGQNTAAGEATVVAGVLEIGDSDHSDATWGGDANVLAGGTLRGHGTITGDVVNSGTVRPGGSVGILTINGDYTQGANATLAIDLTPTGASELVVKGNATIAGGVNLIYAPGTYTAANYTILSARQVTGTFSSLTSSGSVPTGMDAALSYGTDNVSLALAATSSTTPTNPTNPANPTDPTTPTSPVTPVVVAPRDGALFANAQRLANLDGQRILSTVLDASLLPATADCGAGQAGQQNVLQRACASGAWMQATGSNDSLDGGSRVEGTGFGLNAGYDVVLGGNVHMGIEGGVGRINANDSAGSTSRLQSAHGGVYAFADLGPVVLSGVVDAWTGSYDFARATGVGQAVSSPDAKAYSGAFQAALPLQVSGWQLTPKIGALYQRQSIDGFHEQVVSDSLVAADFGVAGQKSTANTLSPFVSASFGREFQAQGVSYVPQFEVGYRYNTRGYAPSVSVIAADGTQFVQSANTIGRGTMIGGARITATQGLSWDVYLDYQGMYGSNLHDNAFTFGFTKHF